METATAVLAGPPSSLSGFLPFHNGTDATVRIVEVTIADTDTDATLVVPVEETVVGPGQRSRVPVRLPLPPQTAPGAYPLAITVADQQVDATAHVEPAHLVALSPGSLVVDNLPGEKTSVTIVVANEGNVPVHLADVSALPLYREDQALVTLHAIADPARLAELDRLTPLPDPVAELVFTLPAGQQVVAAGETRPVEIVLVVPDELPQTHRFLAALPISVATLLLAVVPAGRSRPRDPGPDERPRDRDERPRDRGRPRDRDDDEGPPTQDSTD
jgi:hypothetical protein